MPAYPSCRKCAICLELELHIDEYRSFHANVKDKVIQRLPDHARGFMNGQLSAMTGVIEDLTALVPYLRTERIIKMRNKGE